jgi:hypothetical protein
MSSNTSKKLKINRLNIFNTLENQGCCKLKIYKNIQHIMEEVLSMGILPHLIISGSKRLNADRSSAGESRKPPSGVRHKKVPSTTQTADAGGVVVALGRQRSCRSATISMKSYPRPLT